MLQTSCDVSPIRLTIVAQLSMNEVEILLYINKYLYIYIYML